MSRSLYDMEPDENSDLDEWKKWAYRLRHRAIESEEKKKVLGTEIKNLKRDIEEKNKAFILYKSRNVELENTINNIKHNCAYRLLKLLCSIKGRIKKAVKI